MDVCQRCDLHVHSLYSTDSGNYALRRARLGESYTAPERVYDTCMRRGMSIVTISDHNTLEGGLRIADRPNTFLSEEVTTQFPEDEVPCTSSSGTSPKRITATCRSTGPRSTNPATSCGHRNSRIPPPIRRIGWAPRSLSRTSSG